MFTVSTKNGILRFQYYNLKFVHLDWNGNELYTAENINIWRSCSYLRERGCLGICRFAHIPWLFSPLDLRVVRSAASELTIDDGGENLSYKTIKL